MEKECSKTLFNPIGPTSNKEFDFVKPDARQSLRQGEHEKAFKLLSPPKRASLGEETVDFDPAKKPPLPNDSGVDTYLMGGKIIRVNSVGEVGEAATISSQNNNEEILADGKNTTVQGAVGESLTANERRKLAKVDDLELVKITNSQNSLAANAARKAFDSIDNNSLLGIA